MKYMHERNLQGKISKNYGGYGAEINQFFHEKYLPMRTNISTLTFDEAHTTDFDTATTLFNEYYQALLDFSCNYGIKSQSKFESTFLEEISCFLFKDLNEITTQTFGVFNKGIYAGLKIDSNHHISVIKKDVDFCIGKKVDLTIGDQPSTELILPIVSVEVKTYLDATMFGEIKSSSKSIKSASPNSKTYVLMGYKDLADEHLISARQDSVLNEMFSLRENKYSPILSSVLYQYWEEIKKAVSSITVVDLVPSTGRLLNP